MAAKYPVYFDRQGLCFEADEGMTLLQAEIQAGLQPDAVCGGHGHCGKCRVLADGVPVLACQTAVNGSMHVCVDSAPQSAQPGIWDAPAQSASQPLFAAVDVGTTTVAAYLLDGRTGAQLGQDSMDNPQRQYGADVLLRADYAAHHDGTALSGCIRRGVNALLAGLARSCGRDPAQITKVVMVGNCCMHHLFLELPVDTLAQAPHVPAVTAPVCRTASAVGLDLHPQAQVQWLPNIGGFVGADTVACMLAANLDRRKALTLLVDVGTNGELVLSDGCRFVVCSAAAGPAFEGANIRCGMRAVPGAIDRVWTENSHLNFHVIGDVPPAGICGSGLVDAVWSLRRLDIIDTTGRMEQPWYFAPQVFLTQKDIRQLQLAKAGIAAGIRLLCAHMGIAPAQIQSVLLAGTFGSVLPPQSACGIGLLPPELEPRVLCLGNAAGEGAKLAALHGEAFKRACAMAKRTEHLSLATEPDFQRVYLEEVNFRPVERKSF